MTSPRSARHAAPRHAVPRPHTRPHPRRRARARARGRFGRVALAVAALGGLSTGAGAAALVGPSVIAAAPGQVVAAVTDPEPDPAPARLLDAQVRSTSSREELAADPVLPDVDVPPVPEPLAPVEPVEPVEPALPAGLTAADVAAGLLSAAVPAALDGVLEVVPGSSPAPSPERPVTTVRVEVEAGLEVDGTLFAGTVLTILNDPRGWGADGSVSFARTDAEADVVVVLASPATVDRLCLPLTTEGRYSCAIEGRAILNHARWVTATDEFADPTVYRQYLVNHEVGHVLGNGHEECPAEGALAPVMQQQTVQVAPCLPNAWPHP